LLYSLPQIPRRACLISLLDQVSLNAPNIERLRSLPHYAQTNQHHPSSDHCRNNPGAPPQLNDVQQAQLLEALRSPAPDGGLWNGRKVTDYLHESFGISVSRQQGWVYLSPDGVSLESASS
jgi:hypothetical protein